MMVTPARSWRSLDDLMMTAKMLAPAFCLPLIVAAMLLPLRAALGADESKAVARPDVKIGDRWTYRLIDTTLNRTQYEYEVRVTFVSPKVILTIGGRRGKEARTDSHWTSEWNAMSAGGFTYTPHVGNLKFPITVGATHDSVYTTQRAKSERKTTVVGWEEIAVPAGKFRALKIEVKGTYQLLFGSGGGTTESTIWYVPEVKRWVRFDNRQVWSGGGMSESHQLLEYSLQN